MYSHLAPLTKKVYFIKDVAHITGRSRQTLRRMWMAGSFPKPKMINNRVAWAAETIDEWIRKVLIDN